MFKCTHCGKKWDEVDVVNYKPKVRLRLKEDQVCPDCDDGVLRPIEEQPSVCP